MRKQQLSPPLCESLVVRNFVILFIIFSLVHETFEITGSCPTSVLPITGDNTICSRDTVTLTIQSTSTHKITLRYFTSLLPSVNSATILGGTIINSETAPYTVSFTLPPVSTAKSYYIYAIDEEDTVCFPFSFVVVNINGGGSICVPETVGNTPTLDGQLDQSYSHITEAPYSIPVLGGDTTRSDFIGESSSIAYTSATTIATIVPNADIQDFYITYDPNYLYMLVTGVDTCNDNIDFFIAIDTDNLAGNEQILDKSKAPFTKRVDFAGWSPDYFVAVERIKFGSDYAALYQAGNTLIQADTVASSTLGAGTFEYVGACGSFRTEFRIPWKLIGGAPDPTTGKPYNFALYTTYDPDNFDCFDSGPGIGNAAEFEQLGDRPSDGDHCFNQIDVVTSIADDCSNQASDNNNGAGNNIGVGPGSDDSVNDIDTIQQYYEIVNLGQLSIPSLQPIEPITQEGSLPLPTFPSVNPPPSTTGSCETGAQTFTWYTGTSTTPSNTVITDFSGSVSGPNYYWVKFSNGCFSTYALFVLTLYYNPVATPDNVLMNEDITTDIDVLDNDTDLDGDTLTIFSFPSLPTHGTVSVVSGKVRYVPILNYNGIDSFQYEITDGSYYDTATVSIVISAVNDAPVAANDNNNIITPEDTTFLIDVLANDSDVDGPVLNVFGIDTQPTNGIATVVSNKIRYTPNLNYFGTDSLSYIATDTLLSSVATVVITITSVNDPPIAVDDSAIGDEDTNISVDVLLNDSDVDSTITIAAITTAPTKGTATIDGNIITYVPNKNANGADSFLYTITDGEYSPSAKVDITIRPVNDPPVAVSDSGSTDDLTPITINVLANDYDVDNDPLVASIETQPSNGVASISTGILYTPNVGYSGTDTFQYRVSDGTTSTVGIVTVGVSLGNSVPVAVDDDISDIDEDTTTIIDPLDNDSDDGSLTIDSIGDPSHGTAIINDPATTITYTPNLNYNGADSFSYTITDGYYFATASIDISINAVNDPPKAVQDFATTPEDTVTTINVLNNDVDVDTPSLTISRIVTSPSFGVAKINSLFTTIDYKPDLNYNGGDSFTYEIYDGEFYSTASVSITITPVDDAPIAVSDVVVTPEDTVISFNPLGNDIDYDSQGISITGVGSTSFGTTTFTSTTIFYTPSSNLNGVENFKYDITDVGGPLSSTALITLTINAVNDPPLAVDDGPISLDEDTDTTIKPLTNDIDVDSTLTIVGIAQIPSNGKIVSVTGSIITYSPNANYHGLDSFKYTITDKEFTSTATVYLNVASVNDPPVAVDNTFFTNEDYPILLDPLSDDTDADDDTLIITDVSTPANGITTFTQTSVTYTPNANFFGSDPFTYTIYDGTVSATGNIFMIVNPVNDAPTANPDSVDTDEDVAVTFDPVYNDADIDSSPLYLMSITAPSFGTAVLNGNSITYTPNINTFTIDYIDYVIADSLLPGAITATSTITITINSVNDPPVAIDDPGLSTDEDVPLVIFPMDNDFDIEGDSFYINDILENPSNGIAVFDSNTVTYTPDANFYGTDTIIYSITDGYSSSSATIYVSICPIEDGPVTYDDSTYGDEDTTITIYPLDNDQDDDVLRIYSISSPSFGSVTFTYDHVTYVPNLNYNGEEIITYTAIDSFGLTSTSSILITIDPVNDPPIANSDFVFTAEDTKFTFYPLSNDIDAEKDMLIIVNVDFINFGDNGAYFSYDDNSITYSPDPEFSGTDSLSYTITDGEFFSDGVIEITINAVNDPPIAQNTNEFTDEDTPATFYPNVFDYDGVNDITIDSITTISGSKSYFTGLTVYYVPNSNFNGVDTISYTIIDTAGATVTASIIVDVYPVNDAPQANDDSTTIMEDSSIILSPLSNDIDIDSPDIIITNCKIQDGYGGCDTDSIQFIPYPDFSGDTTITYTIRDNDMLTATATIYITVSPVNDLPYAYAAYFTFSEDSTDNVITVSVYDTEKDSPFPIQSFSNPLFGTATYSPDFTFLYYTPTPNLFGDDFITYSVLDSQGGVSNSATIYITVTNVDDPPTTFTPTISIQEDTPTNVNLLQNVIDIDGDTLFLVSIDTPPTSGTYVAYYEFGYIYYIPDSEYSGADSITYTVTDGENSVLATINFNILPVYDPPTAVDDLVTTDEDVSILISPLSNDYSIERAAIHLDSANPGSIGSTLVSGDTITYTPNPNSYGQDKFTYIITDDQGYQSFASVIISVVSINDPPIANDDYMIADQFLPTMLYVLNNDMDIDGDSLVIIDIPVSPISGIATFTSNYIEYTPSQSGWDSLVYTISDGYTTASATLNIDVGGREIPYAGDNYYNIDEDTLAIFYPLEDDSDPNEGNVYISYVSNPLYALTFSYDSVSVTYQGSENFNSNLIEGYEELQYIIYNDGGYSATATIYININAVNDAPLILSDYSVAVYENTNTCFDLYDLFFDVEGDNTYISTYNNPSYGSASQPNEFTLCYNAISLEGTYNDRIDYKISDESLESEYAAILITVLINTPPVAVDYQTSVYEDSYGNTLSPLNYDYDIENDPFYISQIDIDPLFGDITSYDGQYIYYTPKSDVSDVYDTITYTIAAGNSQFGTRSSQTATITIYIIPVNDPPVTVNDKYTIDEDTILNFDPLENDFDIENDPFAIVSMDQPQYGVITLIEGSSYQYVPDQDFYSGETEYISYGISGDGYTVQYGYIEISVTPVDDPPTLVKDDVSFPEDSIDCLHLTIG